VGRGKARRSLELIEASLEIRGRVHKRRADPVNVVIPASRDGRMTALDILLGPLYSGALAPEHRDDLRKSGLTEVTLQAHRIRSVPPSLIRPLLGFDPSAIRSAYCLPFPDPHGGWFAHVRLNVFPSYRDRHGRTVKYLGSSGTPPRLFFCLATLDAVLKTAAPLWLVEGRKRRSRSRNSDSLRSGSKGSRDGIRGAS
jgi:hypothetical protein